MTDITDSNFSEEVLHSKIPILVDCYTQWCGPCKAMKPLLSQIEKENDGAVRIGYLDMENNPELSEKLKIMSVPTVLIFLDGLEVAKIVGVCSKSRYQDVIDELLS